MPASTTLYLVNWMFAYFTICHAGSPQVPEVHLSSVARTESDTEVSLQVVHYNLRAGGGFLNSLRVDWRS